MKEKKEQNTSQSDTVSASTWAAYSIGEYFRENNWKIVSFFPNSKCSKRFDKKKKTSPKVSCKNQSLENADK